MKSGPDRSRGIINLRREHRNVLISLFAPADVRIVSFRSRGVSINKRWLVPELQSRRCGDPRHRAFVI